MKILIFLTSFVLIEQIILRLLKRKEVNFRYVTTNIFLGVVSLTLGAFIHGLYFEKINLFLGSIFYSERDLFRLALSFLACFVLFDFLFYITHRIHHSINFFWTFHSVHHGDPQLNLSSGLRHSWFEEIYFILFYSPLLLLGFHPKLVIYTMLINYTYQFFTHSAISWPKFLNTIFITPDLHRNHHHSTRYYEGSNYGGVFSFWDRLFGTYTDPIDLKDFRPGIEGYRQDNFIKIQTDPIVAYFKDVFSKNGRKS